MTEKSELIRENYLSTINKIMIKCCIVNLLCKFRNCTFKMSHNDYLLTHFETHLPMSSQDNITFMCNVREFN